MSQSIRSKKGFTLVELVVVIAILAILAAIAIPAVMNVIGKANASSDLANAKTMESALKVGAAMNSPEGGTANPDALVMQADGSVLVGDARTFLENPNGGGVEVKAPAQKDFEFYLNPETLAVQAALEPPTGWVVLYPVAD